MTLVSASYHFPVTRKRTTKYGLTAPHTNVQYCSQAHLYLLVDKEFLHNSPVLLVQASVVQANAKGQSVPQVLVQHSPQQHLQLCIMRSGEGEGREGGGERSLEQLQCLSKRWFVLYLVFCYV